jgi:excinuclease ABC subunit C
MADLFPEGALDLGGSRVLPDGWSPRRTRIDGLRSTQLRSQVRILCPTSAGVYLMLDCEGKIVYVGKAKNLRVRLLSYFRSKSRAPKSRKIIAQARSIVWEVLPGEFPALLRELELIRRWRPSWNVQGQPLRRRLAFLVVAGHPATLTLTRRLPAERVAAFGPVPLSRRTRQAVRWLNDLFQLRDCPPGAWTFFPKPGLFPLPMATGCPRVELGSCLGPCLPDASPKTYATHAGRLGRFLDGTDLSLLADLESRMHDAAQAMQFERAGLIRDQHVSLTSLADRLTRLRSAQRSLSFVYPVLDGAGRTWWYLVHGARVLGCVHEPTTPAEREIVTRRLRAVFAEPIHEGLLEAYEPIDGMMIVVSWFRKHPREHRRAIESAAALSVTKTPVRRRRRA